MFKQAPGSYKAPREAGIKKALGTTTIGVPVFNQYAAGNTAITSGQGEYVSFDLYGGHLVPTNDYHYHIEPHYMTAAKGSEALIGYLLDGFTVYSPKENGKTITNADLDVYRGHFGKTT